MTYFNTFDLHDIAVGLLGTMPVSATATDPAIFAETDDDGAEGVWQANARGSEGRV